MARRPGRELLQARLTPEAVAGWDRAASRHNITLTGLLETYGRAFAEDPDAVPEEIIRRTRQLDRERRSRR